MPDADRLLVLFHGPGCADGFTAAWVAHRKYSDAEFIAVNYGQDPPDVAGRKVYVLDFSFKPDVYLKLIRQARSILTVDHHKSAVEEYNARLGPDFAPDCKGKGAFLFDVGHSGAYLAWKYFFPQEPVPKIVLFVQDRDLWSWEMPRSREVNAALASYSNDFATWDMLANRLEWGTGTLAGEGKAILRYQQQLVESACGNAAEIELDGFKVLAVNATCCVSEVAGRLAEGRAFGVAYRRRGDGKWAVSLRSREGGVDVSEVAKRHGGGGHPAAAGYEVEGGVPFP